MARANRHHLPGYVRHLTHRCHKKESLLKFQKDKKRWISWLFKAKKRFGLCVLNYMDEVRMMEVRRQWVEALLKNGSNKRDARWTESSAVGDKEFVLKTKTRLGTKAISRKMSGKNWNYELREPQISYNPLFAFEKCGLSSENGYFGDSSP